MSAIPLWDGIRPWQQVPFQFSLHVLEKEGGEIKHFEHLALPDTDPRPGLIKELLNSIPPGTCIVHYTAFEKTRLSDLAAWFPKQRKKIDDIKYESLGHSARSPITGRKAHHLGRDFFKGRWYA